MKHTRSQTEFLKLALPPSRLALKKAIVAIAFITGDTHNTNLVKHEGGSEPAYIRMEMQLSSVGAFKSSAT